MNSPSLRSALRLGTSALHGRLDDSIGDFADRRAYVGYLQRTHCFRLAAEQALSVGAGGGGWRIDDVAGLAASDLGDLGAAMLPPASLPARPLNDAARLGACYVLEGSALGARLLARRAESLGMSAEFGARHLFRQASDRLRWTQFLAALESVPADLHDDALEGALMLFGFALSIYSETSHECA